MSDTDQAWADGWIAGAVAAWFLLTDNSVARSEWEPLRDEYLKRRPTRTADEGR